MSIALWLFILPILSSLIAFLSSSAAENKLLKPFAFLLSLIPLCILLYGGYSLLGTDISYPWLPQVGINFHLAIDSITLLFLYLVAIIIPVSILAAREERISQPNLFYGIILLLQAILIGFFMARDLALFTLFWEGMLIPLYFLISSWGGPQRQSAAMKFILYMIAGSALMVAGVLALYFASPSGTFDFKALAETAETSPYTPRIFAIFMLAFAVKTPLFPFHAWLPDAYYQASTPGSILLAAILSKAGIYGVARIGIGFFPTMMQLWSPGLIALAFIGVFYGGLTAWRQNDYKKLIAYSSLSHVNFILIGLFVWNETAHAGGIVQALNHGVTIAALFLVASWLEERLGTTSMQGVHGLAKYLPKLCWLTLFFVLSNVALPGTNNFVGELLILFGLFLKDPWVSAFLALSIILSVIYMLRWMQKTYFETPTPFQPTWIDINAKELLIATPLVLLILWVGIYPSPILKQLLPLTEQSAVVAQLEE